MKDVIRETSKKVRAAKSEAEMYAGQDIKFWSDFEQNVGKLDDLMETILYVERKNRLEYEKEQNARWIIKKIMTIATSCKIELNKPEPKPKKKKVNVEKLI
jgi:hypothetical protein